MVCVLFLLAWNPCDPACAVETDEVPMIDKIERLGFDAVTIHFDTLPGLNYELQFSDDALALTSREPTATWQKLFEIPAFPFPNHFVIVDSMTNVVRVYRLKTTR